jgi:hypothetical protein
MILVAALALVSAPMPAAPVPGPVAGAGWHPDESFPSTPAIQRYGKGRKGMKRFDRSLVREAEFRRFREEGFALRGATAVMEDRRSRCDRLLKDALASGNQAEIEERTEFCRPQPYGPPQSRQQILR